MEQKKLIQVVKEHPFPEYQQWWELGAVLLEFMSEAIVSQWAGLALHPPDWEPIRQSVARYIRLVYHRDAAPALVDRFVARQFTEPIWSGEFDALSFAFYRSAFQLLAQQWPDDIEGLVKERRRFTQRVGQVFFARVREELALDLPTALTSGQQFAALQRCLESVGVFLLEQGYLRDHFAFRFAVQAGAIQQTEADFLERLVHDGVAYAVYEMGYPVILPSAVYLYHTMGEAQHHSSRMIEELFAAMGYQARETEDFDPTGYPAEQVVELWEIRRV